MGDNERQISATLDWLLEPSNPSVRYYTLRDLLDRPESDPEVRHAKNSIMLSGLVPAILEKQREPDYEDACRSFYHTKYYGLVWQLIVLAELGADRNPQIEAQCEYLLANSQVPGQGGFAMQTAVKTGGGRTSEVIPCLTGNMVWSLIRMGYLDDPRLQKGIEWLLAHIHLNDGVDMHEGDPHYVTKDACWGKHTCFMGAVKPLKALAAIPAERRTEEVRDYLDKSAEYFLIHHIYKRSRDLDKVSKPGWLKFAFPLMYQTDALDILDILTGLGIYDSRMDDAIALLRGKQREDGRFRAENSSNNPKLLIPFSSENQHKWVTLRALRVLKRWDAHTTP